MRSGGNKNDQTADTAVDEFAENSTMKILWHTLVVGSKTLSDFPQTPNPQPQTISLHW
jgi:hypothetical protein